MNRKNIVITSFILGIILILVVASFVLVAKNDSEKYPYEHKETISQLGQEGSINFVEKNESNESVNTPATEDPDGILDQICPDDIFGERTNKYNPYNSQEYYLNGCIYDATKKLIKPDYWSARDVCPQTIEEELATNEYNLLNGCLYKDQDNIKIFEKTIHNMTKAGEFGKRFSLDSSGRFKGIGETAEEWFRFEDNGNLYIFFRGLAGCGGCIFNGPYLKINLTSGGIEKNTAEIPYTPYLVLSPNLKKAIEVKFDQIYEEGKTTINNIKLYNYNFIELTRTSLAYQVPDGKNIIWCDHGCSINKGAIEWIDDESIKVQYINNNIIDHTAIIPASEENNEGLLSQDIPAGNPVIIKINNTFDPTIFSPLDDFRVGENIFYFRGQKNNTSTDQVFDLCLNKPTNSDTLILSDLSFGGLMVYKFHLTSNPDIIVFRYGFSDAADGFYKNNYINLSSAKVLFDAGATYSLYDEESVYKINAENHVIGLDFNRACQAGIDSKEKDLIYLEGLMLDSQKIEIFDEPIGIKCRPDGVSNGYEPDPYLSFEAFSLKNNKVYFTLGGLKEEINLFYDINQSKIERGEPEKFVEIYD